MTENTFDKVIVSVAAMIKNMSDTENKTRQLHRVMSTVEFSIINHLASAIFSDETGQIDALNARKAEELYGWKITRRTKDSFGWVKGIIHTNKGQLVFG